MKAKATRVSIKRLNSATQYEDTTENDYRSRTLEKIGCVERKIHRMKASATQIRNMIEKGHLELEANAYIEMETTFGEIMVQQCVMIEELEALTQELMDMEDSIPSVDVVDAYVNFGFNRHPNFIAKLIHKTQTLTQHLTNTKALIQDILTSIKQNKANLLV